MKTILIVNSKVELYLKVVMLKMKTIIGPFSLKLHPALRAWKQADQQMHLACCPGMALKLQMANPPTLKPNSEVI